MATTKKTATKRKPSAKKAAPKKPAAKKPVKKPAEPHYEPPHPIPSVVPDGGLSALLRLPEGPVDLSTHDTRHTLGYPSKKGKDDRDNVKLDMLPRLTDLQERLFAAGRANPETAPRLLLLLQGMDTSGKGGVIRHAVGMVDPQGVDITSFKSPTKEELEHDFLWRIEKALPGPGQIGVFDRSQYEDVLIVRVDELVEQSEWESRYERINAFEAGLAAQGITLVKCFLNVSFERQKERLMERLERPDKYWKYNEGDLVVRAKWPQYMEAYEDALERCNTDVAPWYVIPADRKWYRNWAVAQLLLEHLEALDLSWPEADYDVEEQKAKLAAS
ncbi:PPK2 family polyphosphate kinase [Propionibacteriaceae bacterium Y1923]|uniref:PPK2 family polyphosphate kinase n=1 Tax=Aestuariimicrobium sp. Y1814 TaxID=3418742 RepID=UPI003C266653